MMTPDCAHDVAAEQMSQKATVRGAAPTGKLKTAFGGVLRRGVLPAKDMAAPALPARSAMKVRLGGAGLLKAPTPSLASHER